MKQQRILLLAFAVLQAGASACSSDSLGFCVEQSKAQCHLQFTCCTAAERTALFGSTNVQIGPYYDEGGCVDAFTRQCEAFSQVTDESIALKRTTFDSEKAAKCNEDKNKAANECDADAFFNRDDNCAQLFEGAVADGGKCTQSSECKELGSQCEVDQTPNNDGQVTITLEGECKGKGDAGEPCFDGGLCSRGLRCVQDQTTFQQTCEPPAGAGGACNSDVDCDTGLRCSFATGPGICTQPGEQGASCNADQDCADGLRCLTNDVSQRVCSVPGQDGSQCFSNSECAAGFLCNTNRDVCAAPSGQGEECPAGTSQCLPGLDCRTDDSFTSRCFAGVEGDPCRNQERCAAGLQCRFDSIAGSNKCLAPLAQNQPCESSVAHECASPLVCRANASFQDICQAPLAANAPCDTPNFGGEDPCDATHRCQFDDTAVADICVPRLGAGQSCFDEFTCTQGTFCSASNVCTNLLGAGTACNETSDCASPLTCRFNDTSTTRICRAISAEGQVCSTLADCAPGLDCRGDDNNSRTICRGASDDGGRCESTADCGAGEGCRQADDFSGTICRGPSEQGEACSSAIDCAVGLECRFDNGSGQNACLGKAAEGEGCSTDTDCDGDLVCRSDFNTGAFTCKVLGDVGASCQSDGDCDAGLRCRDLGDPDGVQVCTDKNDDGNQCRSDDDCVSGSCDTVAERCGAPAEDQSFEICNGI